MPSAGSRQASGMISLRYSAIASVSHTVAPSWRRQGTKIEDDSSRISARADAGGGGECIAQTPSRKTGVKTAPPTPPEKYFLLVGVGAVLAFCLSPNPPPAPRGADPALFRPKPPRHKVPIAC